jgi:predicted aspartyl protease
MGLTRVDVVIANPKEPTRSMKVEGCLVDRSELTWVPRRAMARIGIGAEKRRRFVLADRRVVERSVGFAILRLGRYRTIDEVVFGYPDHLLLLGARSLAGFGLAVDPQPHRLRATSTIAAQNRSPGRRRTVTPTSRPRR